MVSKNSLHKTLMNSLALKHQQIFDLIKNKSVIYTDIPIYNNIGDILIMMGTFKFFNKNHINIKSISSLYNFNKKNINEDDVIVFQGGGNLGDLYCLHQEFRENIIKKYLNNRIIILPQTIYFESDQKYQECCKIFSKHNNLHIFVRDKSSYTLALPMSKNIYLAPDMAHQLYPISYINKENKKTLLIERKDKELSAINLKVKPNTVTDWNILLKNHYFIIGLFKKGSKFISVLRFPYIFSNMILKLWIVYSKSLTNKAINLFAGHEIILTNRLHGHILACLMDKKNIVYDGSYKKISSYIDVWTKNSNLVNFNNKY